MPHLKVLTPEEAKQPSKLELFLRALYSLENHSNFWKFVLRDGWIKLWKLATLENIEAAVKFCAVAIYNAVYNAVDTFFSILRSARWVDGDLDDSLYSAHHISNMSIALHAAIGVPVVAFFLVEYVYKKLHASRIDHLSYAHAKLKEHQQEAIQHGAPRVKLMVRGGEDKVATWYANCSLKTRQLLQDLLAPHLDLENDDNRTEKAKDKTVVLALQRIIKTKLAKTPSQDRISTDELLLGIIDHLAMQDNEILVQMLAKSKATLDKERLSHITHNELPDLSASGKIKMRFRNIWHDLDNKTRFKNAVTEIWDGLTQFVLYYGLSFWIFMASVTSFIKPASKGDLSDVSPEFWWAKFAAGGLGILLLCAHLPFSLARYVRDKLFRKSPEEKLYDYQEVPMDDTSADTKKLNNKRLANLSAAEKRELNVRYFIKQHRRLLELQELFRQQLLAKLFKKAKAALNLNESEAQVTLTSAKAAVDINEFRKRITKSENFLDRLESKKVSYESIEATLTGKKSTFYGRYASVILAGLTGFTGYFGLAVLAMWIIGSAGDFFSGPAVLTIGVFSWTAFAVAMPAVALAAGLFLAVIPVALTIKANREMANAVKAKKIEIEIVAKTQNDLQVLLLEAEELLKQERREIASLHKLIKKTRPYSEIASSLALLGKHSKPLPTFLKQNALSHIRFLETLNLQEFSWSKPSENKWTAFKKVAVRLKVAIMGGVTGSFIVRAFFVVAGFTSLTALAVAGPAVALVLGITFACIVLAIAAIKVWNYDLAAQKKAHLDALNGLPVIQENNKAKMKLVKEHINSASENIAKIRQLKDQNQANTALSNDEILVPTSGLTSRSTLFNKTNTVVQVEHACTSPSTGAEYSEDMLFFGAN